MDKKGKQLFVLTSQTGTFPCYFSWIEDFFILSTSYGKIQKLLSEKTLNLNSAFDYFGFSFTNLPQDFTILEETKEVPPATLFQLNSKFYFRLIPLIRPEEFFGKKLEPFSSLGEFTNELTSLLKKIVKERRERIGNLPLAGELSSGYDSGLVAYALNEIGANDVVFYSWFSNEDLEDSDPRLVERFAQKHNLKVVFWDKSSFFPFFPNLVPRA